MNTLNAMDDKPSSMCLSPQEKLNAMTLAQRKKSSSHHAAAAMAAAVAVAVCVDSRKPPMDSMEVDLDTDGWISDDNLRSMEFDERVNNDIDWVMHDDLELSLDMNFAPVGADDNDQDFAFGPNSFLSPLRGGLAYDDDDDVAEMSSSPSFEPMNVEPASNATHAEKLLMSFDTMNFTIPSPTSASSRKKRAALFGKQDEKTVAAPQPVGRSAAASKGSMSPSLKLKVTASSAAAEELRKEHARVTVPAAAAASKAPLSITAPDALLGVLNIVTPTGKPSDSNKKIGSYSPQARKLRIQKFHEKRKNRTWKKSIKYDCRKKLADDRPRIKGRFVRVLENDNKDESMSPTSGDASPSVLPSFPLPSTPTSSTPPALALSDTDVVVPAVAAIPTPALVAVAPVVVTASTSTQPTTPPQPTTVTSPPTMAIAPLITSAS